MKGIKTVLDTRETLALLCEDRPPRLAGALATAPLLGEALCRRRHIYLVLGTLCPLEMSR